MKKIIAFLFLLNLSFCLVAQDKPKIYNPQANAASDIAAAVTLADSLGKHVFLQIGGNWCPWCIKFNKFCLNDAEIDSLFRSDYVVVHVNYSSENKNLDVMKTLGYPQRFGFPVFVILDGKGNRLHTQDSGLLEKGDSYDRNKILTFLQNWSPKALKPENYSK
jgi:thioredoxin-related protein